MDQNLDESTELVMFRTVPAACKTSISRQRTHTDTHTHPSRSPPRFPRPTSSAPHIQHLDHHPHHHIPHLASPSPGPARSARAKPAATLLARSSTAVAAPLQPNPAAPRPLSYQRQYRREPYRRPRHIAADLTPAPHCQPAPGSAGFRLRRHLIGGWCVSKADKA